MHYNKPFCLISYLFLIVIPLRNCFKFDSAPIETSTQFPQHPSVNISNITCPSCSHSCIYSSDSGPSNTDVCIYANIWLCFKGCFKQCPKYTVSWRFIDLAPEDPCKTCNGNPCQNNGVCINISNDTKRDEKYECRCSKPFFGKQCERWRNDQNQFILST